MISDGSTSGARGHDSRALAVHHGGAMLGQHQKFGMRFDYRQGRAVAAHRVQFGKQGCVHCSKERRSCRLTSRHRKNAANRFRFTYRCDASQAIRLKENPV